MQKVLVIGCSGAGKSTFARALQEKTGLPLYYLDMLWHTPDRGHITREAFDRTLGEWLARPAWIIDGNYNRTLPMRLAKCDAVFFLDYPTAVCLDAIRGRVGQLRPDMPWVEEQLDPEFYEWVSNFARDERPLILAALAARAEQPDPPRVFTFHSREEAAAWLAGCGRVTVRPYRTGDCPALANWQSSLPRRSTPSAPPTTPPPSWTPGPRPRAPTLRRGTGASARTSPWWPNWTGGWPASGTSTRLPATSTGCMWAGTSSGGGRARPSAARWKPPARCGPSSHTPPAPPAAFLKSGATASCARSRWSGGGRPLKTL